mmetsp:Transcript_33880/g.78238  ORF Transcript_33880/g.78238 Transcript_33880/m.78238 type:complete len:541 (-) Transcript_33880:225-1847(-)
MNSESCENDPWVSGIQAPNANDVICGRGGGTNGHPGNVLFRDLVRSKKKLYLMSRFKREKRMIAQEVIAGIRDQNPSGRFLIRDDKTGRYHDIGDKKAWSKASQALREGAPSIRKQIYDEVMRKSRRSRDDKGELEENDDMHEDIPEMTISGNYCGEIESRSVEKHTSENVAETNAFTNVGHCRSFIAHNSFSSLGEHRDYSLSKVHSHQQFQQAPHPNPVQHHSSQNCFIYDSQTMNCVCSYQGPQSESEISNQFCHQLCRPSIMWYHSDTPQNSTIAPPSIVFENTSKSAKSSQLYQDGQKVHNISYVNQHSCDEKSPSTPRKVSVKSLVLDQDMQDVHNISHSTQYLHNKNAPSTPHNRFEFPEENGHSNSDQSKNTMPVLKVVSNFNEVSEPLLENQSYSRQNENTSENLLDENKFSLGDSNEKIDPKTGHAISDACNLTDFFGDRSLCGIHFSFTFSEDESIKIEPKLPPLTDIAIDSPSSDSSRGELMRQSSLSSKRLSPMLSFPQILDKRNWSPIFSMVEGITSLGSSSRSVS